MDDLLQKFFQWDPKYYRDSTPIQSVTRVRECLIIVTDLHIYCARPISSTDFRVHVLSYIP